MIPKPQINWAHVASVGGTLAIGGLTLVSALPQSPLMAFVPPQYQAIALGAGVLASAILGATAAHQGTKAALPPPIILNPTEPAASAAPASSIQP